MKSDRSTDLQVAIAQHLSAQPYFHGGGTLKSIAVITERIGDIASEIDELIGKIGVCVKVTTPESINTQKNAPVPIIRPTVVLTVYEDVTVNSGMTGSQQPASKVADACAYYLHQSDELGHWLIFSEKSLNRQEPELLAYDVIFEGAEMALTEPRR